ncbi:MAG: hypothetical protein L3J56_02750 [Bacteroidales bacterium]|nr:hypothetical protein [Bacteroidales bacterium]
MKKNILYIFFLIILPISFGSSENTGCSGIKQPNNQEQTDNPTQAGNSSDNKTAVNSQK